MDDLLYRTISNLITDVEFMAERVINKQLENVPRLHDQYTMAALTGLLSNSHFTDYEGFHKETAVRAGIMTARAWADEAIKQREEANAGK